jgi:hypothetical protein
MKSHDDGPDHSAEHEIAGSSPSGVLAKTARNLTGIDMRRVEREKNMNRQTGIRGLSVVCVWISLGSILSASSCDIPGDNSAQMQTLERWNAEYQRKLDSQIAAASWATLNNSQLNHTGRTDCPGNACVKKDTISTP